MLRHKYEVEGHTIRYIRLSETPESERAGFEAWIFHQTRPEIPGLEPQDAVYTYDYQRWREMYLNEPTFWDDAEG